MARPKKFRDSPLYTSLNEDDKGEDKSLRELGREDVIERLDRLEWDDLRQEDRELQKAFQDIDAAQKSKVGIKYDSRQKLRAALAYTVTASSKEASRLTGVPAQTIRYWKAEAPWWPTAVKYALAAQKEGLDAKLGQVLDKALENVMQRLELGDPHVYKHKYVDDEGILQEEIRIGYKPVSAKDLMVITSIARDKQSLLRGEATSISEKKSDKEVLENVANKLAETILQHQAPKGIVGTYDKKGNKIED